MPGASSAHPHVEPEPPEWQPRAIWVGGRLLCGSISFFFASFLFAFFYLKALDVNHNWKIGNVTPDGGIGLAVAALFLFNVVRSLLIKREPAPANPWNAKSIEWTLPTPVPVHDFDRLPVFDEDPYPYGIEAAPARAPALAPAGGSA